MTTSGQETAPSAGARSRSAEELFESARLTGSLELCSLTDDEESVLGGGQWALTDPAVWRAYVAQSPADRADVVDAVRASLLDADLAWARPDGDEIDLAPTLAIVLIARTYADFLVVPRSEGQRTELSALPLGYALADDTHGLRGIVVESRQAGVHRYRFMTIEEACGVFADWARAAHKDVQDAVIEVMRFDQANPAAAGVVVRQDESVRVLGLDGVRSTHGLSRLDDAIKTILDQAASRGRGPR